MDEFSKVFKLPDGKGGTKYQIMTADGEWLDTDEEGHILGEAPDSPEPAAVKAPRKKGKAAAPSRSTFLSVQFRQEDYDLLSKYVFWYSLNHEPISRSGLAQQLVMERIRKDKEFQEFRGKGIKNP